MDEVDRIPLKISGHGILRGPWERKWEAAARIEADEFIQQIGALERTSEESPGDPARKQDAETSLAAVGERRASSEVHRLLAATSGPVRQKRTLVALSAAAAVLAITGTAVALLPPAERLRGSDHYQIQPASQIGPPVSRVASRPSANFVSIDARETLNDILIDDRAKVESLVGRWVPQVFSMAPGTDFGPVTYDYPEILQRVRAIREVYPNTLLLNSSDYTSFQRGGFYVAVIDRPESDAGEVLDWCKSQRFQREDCLAKRLSHTEGPATATLLR
ncbi:hypothetical protein [Actinokineospora cianjurensis]|uniref:Uncharacterized protein n=1 Tax=Actinokineospora cianjurensis TaxID=585224 RepID=A0A421BAJ2_9PSEU|nr:hypothetical protein [Actinokineospora cianjurensis]RLK61153.1 hypothetical protein CLV68_1668 [Actinokineospora cianjurensis]